MATSNQELVLRAYDLVRRTFGALRRGDDFPVEVAEICAPDVVVQEVPEFPDAATYRGFDGLARWVGNFVELYEDIAVETGDLVEVGDTVIVPTRQRFRSRAGVETEQDVVHVWTLRDGLVARVAGYRDMESARAAAGLPDA